MAKRNVLFTLFFVSFYIALCLSLCTSKSPTSKQDRRTNINSLTVATYNTEWLFLANTETGDCPPAGCQYPTLSAAMAHIRAVAGEIVDINADIIVLEEVEGCETLDVLNEEIGLHFGYKPYLLPGTDTYTGQNVGILTRIDPLNDLERASGRADFPVPGNSCGASDSGDEGVSKNVYASFNVSETIVHIFGMHLLAYPDDKVRCLEREAQATVIAAFMESNVVNTNEETIVLGDLNDFSPSMSDAANSKPISRVLTFLADGLLELYGTPLTNVGTYDSQPTRYSAWWDKNKDCVSEQGELTAIDHLLVSPGLNSRLVSADYYHNYQATCTAAVSDHFAVVATFDMSS